MKSPPGFGMNLSARSHGQSLEMAPDQFNTCCTRCTCHADDNGHADGW
jgi:hypothetical protein